MFCRSTGEQYMDFNGDLHIMCNRRASSIIEFLLGKAQEARELRSKHKRYIEKNKIDVFIFHK